MASSRVMASSSQANSDLKPQPPIYLPPSSAPVLGSGGDRAKGIGYAVADGLFRNAYGEEEVAGESSAPRQGGFGLPKAVRQKTAEEVWREITAGQRAESGGDGEGGSSGGEMTLEDFLAARTGGAAMDNDGGLGSGSEPGFFEADATTSDRTGQLPGIGFENRAQPRGRGRGTSGTKRLWFDSLEEKAAWQRQKRMIKNRESAARSREKKQAYTAELESLVAQLEEENVQLLRHQEERQIERLKQLMENRTPVTESRKPRPPLLKTNSMEW